MVWLHGGRNYWCNHHGYLFTTPSHVVNAMDPLEVYCRECFAKPGEKCVERFEISPLGSLVEINCAIHEVRIQNAQAVLEDRIKNLIPKYE